MTLMWLSFSKNICDKYTNDTHTDYIWSRFHKLLNHLSHLSLLFIGRNDLKLCDIYQVAVLIRMITLNVRWGHASGLSATCKEIDCLQPLRLALLAYV